MDDINSIFRAVGTTMSSGLETARRKMPSTETMRSSIVSGGAKLGRSLSKGAGSIRTGFENVKGGRRMQSAGEKATAAGRSISKFCSTNWARTADARGKIYDFFKELGFRHYDSVGSFFFRFDEPKESKQSSNSESVASHVDTDTVSSTTQSVASHVDTDTTSSTTSDLKRLISEQKSWRPIDVYNNKPLLKGMTDWAETTRNELPNADPHRTSLDPILMLGDIDRLENSTNLREFSSNFNSFVEKYLPQEDGSFSFDIAEPEDSFEVNVSGAIKNEANNLSGVPEDSRDENWRQEAMRFLKNDLLIGSDGINRDLTFSSQSEGNLSPVRYFLQENT